MCTHVTEKKTHTHTKTKRKCVNIESEIFRVSLVCCRIMEHKLSFWSKQHEMMAHVFLISIFIHSYFSPKARWMTARAKSERRIVVNLNHKIASLPPIYDRCMIKNSFSLSRSVGVVLPRLFQDKLILLYCKQAGSQPTTMFDNAMAIWSEQKYISRCDTISHTHEHVELKVKLWLIYRLSASLAYSIWDHKHFHQNQ